VKLFPDNYFDFVYIDANHTWQGITNDIHDWWPKVKLGGYLCGHDYIYKGVLINNELVWENYVHVRSVVHAWAEVCEADLFLSNDGPAHSWGIRRDR
jgi:disulfide oxidoreductase YuzD